MLVTEDKILVHFDTNDVSTYVLKDTMLNMLNKECFVLEEKVVNDILLASIDKILDDLEKLVGQTNNERIRLYATGMFQKFTEVEQTKLIIHIYVNYGLYLNIVKPDLEEFYLEKSSLYGAKDIIKGLVHQEFRKVVVCGSFQQHLKEIGEVMNLLYEHDTQVLSPWTTKIVPETLGTNFILLEGQEPLKNERDAWKHKYEHMDKFRQSDAIIVCNPDGLVGKGTMFEFGFMVALSKRIIFTERPKE